MFFAAIESVEENCKINRQSLFLEKPLNVFDLNFELLHSNVVYLPGMLTASLKKVDRVIQLWLPVVGLSNNCHSVLLSNQDYLPIETKSCLSIK